jgi:hypothetical protein
MLWILARHTRVYTSVASNNAGETFHAEETSVIRCIDV